MAKVLVSDPIAQEGIDILKQAAEVDVKTGLSPEELISIIGNYDALAVRSETKATAAVLDAAPNLKIIGRAGVGVDNIDVAKATERGILVVNSPEGNTLAAAELTVAMLLSLARNIAPADQALRNGEWKRSKYVGSEVYNKTLGVIGLGKIGREVAKRLQAFGMPVIAYDPFATAEMADQLGIELVDLPTLYSRSDYITLHVPKTKETSGMIGASQLASMKKGVRLVNVARGGLIDEPALAEALKSGQVAGAAIDVYSTEPVPADNPLIGLPNVLHTPHLGASTEEAQVNVAIDIAEQIVDVLAGKPARSAVNMPALGADLLRKIQPYMTLAERIGSLHAQIDEGAASQVDVIYSGSYGSDLPTVHLTRAVLKGLLDVSVPESVNYVNAPGLAERRGIKVLESKGASEADSGNSGLNLAVRVTASGGETREISGTVFSGNEPRILYIDKFRVNVDPNGPMLVTEHTDRPGVIGKVGTLLGDAGVNIAGMHLGREGQGQGALMILKLDQPVSDEVLAHLRQIDGMETAKQVTL